MAGARLPQGDLLGLHPPRRGCARWRPGAKLGPKLAPLVPTERLKSMLSLAPAKATYRPLPEAQASKAPVKRGTVAFMQGCIQRVFFGDVNAATLRVLSAEGWEVHSPRSPRCCGALQMHAGVDEEAIAAGRGDDRRLRGLRPHRHQRRRLRLGDEGLRAHPRHRPRARVLRQGRRRPRAAGERGAAGRAQADRAARRLPRRLPPRARPGRRACSRASCCAASRAWSCSSPPSGSCAAARPASTTCSSPRPPASSARARRRTCARPARTRSPRPTRAARCRSPSTSISRSITR